MPSSPLPTVQRSIQDFCKGYADGSVLTGAQRKDRRPRPAEKLAEVEAGLADGSIKVFDTSTFTVEGEALTSALLWIPTATLT